MLDKLELYRKAFLDFRRNKNISYDLYSRSLIINLVILPNLLSNLTDAFRGNRKMAESTPYFLITEEDCKKFLLEKSPILERPIEDFLKASAPLAEENKRFLERVNLFPFSKEAIIVLKESGIKIRNKELEEWGLYNSQEHIIYLSAKIEREDKEKALFHEACHAFYQLPLLPPNMFIEGSIEKIVSTHFKSMREDLGLLN